jgi:hypothetical protein
MTFDAESSDPASCIKTDISKIETLRNIYFFEDGHKCLRCNEQGRVELFQHKNPQEAYMHFKEGMLGTGESEYSRLLPQYFNEGLENFHAYERIDESIIDQFKEDIDVLGKISIAPAYDCIRYAINDLIREAHDLQKTVRLQKEMIFFIMLEGDRNDYRCHDDDGDYCCPFAARLRENMKKLTSLLNR